MFLRLIWPIWRTLLSLDIAEKNNSEPWYDSIIFGLLFHAVDTSDTFLNWHTLSRYNIIWKKKFSKSLRKNISHENCMHFHEIFLLLALVIFISCRLDWKTHSQNAYLTQNSKFSVFRDDFDCSFWCFRAKNHMKGL